MRTIYPIMRKVALYMGLSDYYEHGIARGVVRYARTKKDWRIFGSGWMFSRLEDILT
jgi:LacI family transcriptional regulator